MRWLHRVWLLRSVHRYLRLIHLNLRRTTIVQTQEFINKSWTGFRFRSGKSRFNTHSLVWVIYRVWRSTGQEVINLRLTWLSQRSVRWILCYIQVVLAFSAFLQVLIKSCFLFLISLLVFFIVADGGGFLRPFYLLHSHQRLSNRPLLRHILFIIL
jgi:hypothetical protein